jgi:hypothetical protein
MKRDNNGKPTVARPLQLSNGNAMVTVPLERSWVTVSEFSRITHIAIKTVRDYIRQGRIATKAHPHVNRRRVIPVRELNRTMMNPAGALIPYHGRMYPHSFYIFYCLASYGSRFEMIKRDLERYRVVVPPMSVLRAMEEAIFETAPKIIKRKHRLGFRYNTLIEFENWMEILGFKEIYEDPLGYIPARILNSQRLRMVMEVMASAGFRPYEISDKLHEVTDVLVDPSIISNYLLMFFYHRQMEDDDWYDYLIDVRAVNAMEAKIRDECADSKVAVYQHLGLTGGIDILTEFEKNLYVATNLYRKMATSEDFMHQQASVAQTRAMGNLVAIMMKWKEIHTKESAELQQRRQAAQGQGLNPANIPEKSAEDNDEVFEEVIQKEAEDESVSSA